MHTGANQPQRAHESGRLQIAQILHFKNSFLLTLSIPASYFFLNILLTQRDSYYIFSAFNRNIAFVSLVPPIFKLTQMDGTRKNIPMAHLLKCVERGRYFLSENIKTNHVLNRLNRGVNTLLLQTA